MRGEMATLGLHELGNEIKKVGNHWSMQSPTSQSVIYCKDKKLVENFMKFSLIIQRCLKVIYTW